MNRATKRLVMSAALLATAASASAAELPFYENFNSGSLPGWIGGGAYDGTPSAVTPSLVSGAYRLAGPVPNATGFLSGVSQQYFTAPTSIAPANFVTSVDIVDWDHSVRQQMGVFGRVTFTDTGSFATGYYASLVNRRVDPNTNFSLITLDSFSNGALVFGQSRSITGIDPTHDYRVTLSAFGTTVRATVIDLSTGANLGTLTSPSIAATVFTGPGLTGIGAVGNSTAFGVDATFDNFAVVPEPAVLGLLAPVGMLLARRRR